MPYFAACRNIFVRIEDSGHKRQVVKTVDSSLRWFSADRERNLGSGFGVTDAASTGRPVTPAIDAFSISTCFGLSLIEKLRKAKSLGDS